VIRVPLCDCCRGQRRDELITSAPNSLREQFCSSRCKPSNAGTRNCIGLLVSLRRRRRAVLSVLLQASGTRLLCPVSGRVVREDEPSFAAFAIESSGICRVFQQIGFKCRSLIFDWQGGMGRILVVQSYKRLDAKLKCRIGLEPSSNLVCPKTRKPSPPRWLAIEGQWFD
jgi:hypothetical protein